MKELHPQFRYHTSEWLTWHFLIGHCHVMSSSFTKLGNDPDLVAYQNYMSKESQDWTNKVDQAIKRHRIGTDRLSVLPGLKVNILISAVNILTPLGLRHCEPKGRRGLQYHGMLLWVHLQGWHRTLPVR